LKKLGNAAVHENIGTAAQALTAQSSKPKRSSSTKRRRAF
jgi:hypothetical protein